MKKKNHLLVAQQTLKAEAQGILEAMKGLDENFSSVVEILLNISGKAVLAGSGKSGHIARKISSTLASTGTPSFYLHPSEAGHGDLGMVSKGDCIIAVSYSGESAELESVIAYAKRLALPCVLISGGKNSSLKKAVANVIAIKISSEACPLNLAPTSSTTATLAVGDALAMALLSARGFTPKEFAATHPAGSLGRRLLLRVSDLMIQGDDVPKVKASSTIAQAIIEMSEKRLGMTTVLEKNKIGVFTDGDLRRYLANGTDVHKVKVGTVMTKNPTTIEPTQLVDEALFIMEKNQITTLIVCEKNKIKGVIDIHSIMQRKLA